MNERRDLIVAQVQKLFVAGALGAFFTGIAFAIPWDAKAAVFLPGGGDFDWLTTVRMALKYLYMLWLLWYFVLTNMENEELGATRGMKDLVFDILQSLLAIAAAYFLGFVDRAVDYGLRGYGAANISIAGICLLALILFPTNARAGVNFLRVIGLLCAVLGAVVAFWGFGKYRQEDSLLLLQVVLCILLFLYYRIVRDTPRLDDPKRPRRRSAAERAEASANAAEGAATRADASAQEAQAAADSAKTEAASAKATADAAREIVDDAAKAAQDAAAAKAAGEAAKKPHAP